MQRGGIRVWVGRFKICEIDTFNDNDIRAFATQWFGRESRKIKSFLSDIGYSISCSELCKTPLLLTLLCIGYDFARSIPRHRAELYETCVDALMFRWDAYRSIDRRMISERITPSIKKRILSSIGRAYFDNDEYLFKRNDLESEISRELSLYDVGNIKATDIVYELEAHHGLIVEQYRDMFSFSHLSFHEYFTACSYVGCDDVTKLIGIVVEQPRYREVFLMAIEMVYDANRIILGICGKSNMIFCKVKRTGRMLIS
jgi:predicted NACHT family NTPase